MQERRLEVRLLCADMVDVAWEDRLGRPRRATALLEDISESGACLQFEVAVPLGTELHIACTQGDLTGTVRYCLYREIGYFVGVQFADNTRWSRQDYEPQHLLDLERLMAAGRRKSRPH
jgi:hypothetical protein